MDEPELLERLSKTPLQGRRTLRLDIQPTDEWALAVEIKPEEVLTTWQVARSIVEETGRWPLITTCWAKHEGSWEERLRAEDFFSRFFYHGQHHDVSPRAIIKRCPDAKLDEFLRLRASVLVEIEETGDLGRAEDAAQGEPPEDGHLEWFQPINATALLLLPTAHGPESLAYISWYGAADQDVEPYIALLTRWHHLFGAELVAHFGTMLEFVVERPPSDLEQATQLAREQVSVAPCTTIPAGVSLTAHARALLGRKTWFLHERP